MPIIDILANDGTYFVQGTVTEVNLPTAMVSYTPAERPGAAPERFRYDYLVLALGARLAFDKIEGFGEYSHTFTDTYYGNKLRRYLHNGGYKGGPIAIGSSHFRQGKKGKPAWLPDAEAACEGPALEAALALAAWLEEHKAGGAKKITLFTPGKVIAEDAGERIVAEFLGMATQMGFNYKNNTRDISRITAEGIEFASGDHLEAELKIVFPNWEPHEFIRRLPITDEAGFVVTDLTMRNPDYPNVFAVGDCASVTVPKLGTHGHRQAEIVSKQIAKDLGKISAEEADKPFWPEIICIGDMGRHRAFYIHSDTWYGGKVSEFKMGYRYQALKLGFKKMYYQTGGKPPSWGIALTEFLAEQL